MVRRWSVWYQDVKWKYTHGKTLLPNQLLCPKFVLQIVSHGCDNLGRINYSRIEPKSLGISWPICFILTRMRKNEKSPKYFDTYCYLTLTETRMAQLLIASHTLISVLQYHDTLVKLLGYWSVIKFNCKITKIISHNPQKYFLKTEITKLFCPLQDLNHRSHAPR